MPEWYSRRARPRQWISVIPEGVDELALAHGRAAFDPDLGRPLLELVLRPVLVVLGLAALAAGLAAAPGIGDARRFLLARTLATEGLVLLVVLDRRPVVLRHGLSFRRRHLSCRRRSETKTGSQRSVKAQMAPM